MSESITSEVNGTDVGAQQQWMAKDAVVVMSLMRLISGLQHEAAGLLEFGQTRYAQYLQKVASDLNAERERFVSRKQHKVIIPKSPLVVL